MNSTTIYDESGFAVGCVLPTAGIPLRRLSNDESKAKFWQTHFEGMNTTDEICRALFDHLTATEFRFAQNPIGDALIEAFRLGMRSVEGRS